MADYFSFIGSLMPYFLQGLLTTIEVSLLASLLGILLALLITLIRLVNIRVLVAITDVYVSFMRGTPLMVQIFVIFYSLAVLGLNVPAFLTGVIALSLNTGAFSAEILRGGLNAIPRGQFEAAEVLGISKGKTYARIIFPQILITQLSPLVSEFINIIKVSPMVSMIAVVELTRVGQRFIATTFQPIPIYLTLAALYFIVATLLEVILEIGKRKLAKFQNESK